MVRDGAVLRPLGSVMEASLQHLSSICDAELSAGDPHSSEDLDLPAVDPFVEYVNGMLMEEVMEGSTCMPQEAESSYRSIITSFYGMLGECLPPNSASDSAASEGMSDFHMPPHKFRPSFDSRSSQLGFAHQIGPCDRINHSEPQPVIAEQLNVASSSLTRDIHNVEVSRAAYGDSHRSFKQGMAELLYTNHGVAHNPVSGPNDIAYGSYLEIVRQFQLTAPSAVIEHCGDCESTNARGEHKQGRGNSHIGCEQGRREIPCVDHTVVQRSFPQCFGVGFQSPLQTARGNVHVLAEHHSEFIPSYAMNATGEHEQRMGNFKSLSQHKNALFDSESIRVSFEELKLKAGYTDLYVGVPSTSTSCAKSIGSNGYKNKSSTWAFHGSKSKIKGSADIVAFVDTAGVLVNCAEAVALGDVKNVSKILQELYQVHGASPYGNALQRIAHYFSEALISRLAGLRERQCRAMCEIVPSALAFLKASKLGYEVSPYLKAIHFFANQNILKAAEGASRLHIVDYGALYGMQWPCLINALADREGGPPLLVITCIEFPQRSHNRAEQLEETGRRLAAYARTYNVPFQYHAIVADKWEDIDSTSLPLHKNEVLVVNCVRRFRHIADECVSLGSTISPRQKLLTSIHSLNPHLLLTSHMHAPLSSPFFVSRFREAFYFFSNIFDMLETVWGDNPERLFVERSCYARDILNVVACEGAERVERPETYKKWDLRTKRAGFKQLPISAVILSRLKAHVKQQYHKNFFVDDDNKGWMLLGWKGRTMVALSAWKPIPE